MTFLLFGTPSLCHPRYGVLASPRVYHVDRAGDARIERMDRPQDFQRPVGVGDGRVQQRRFIRAALILTIARTAIPCCRHNGLVVFDRFATDLDPVSERAARSLVPSIAHG